MSVESPVLKRFLGKEQLAILLRQGWFLSMPSKSIGIGESWPFALQLPTPMGNVKLAGVYKLTGSETRGTVPCWKLEVSGEMTEKPAPMQKSSTPSTDAKEAELEDKLAAMGLSVNKANLSGVIYFNPAEQLIHDSEILTDIKIGLAKVTSTTTSKPMELPISQKLTLELRRVP